MTQRSPPRRTSSSSASAAEKDRPGYAAQAGTSNEAAETSAQQSSSHQAACDSSRDPGHLFSFEKTDRHIGYDGSMPRKDEQPADATPSSGPKAHESESAKSRTDDRGHGQSSTSPSALISSKYGQHTNPRVGPGSGTVSADEQSKKRASSYTDRHAIDEQARKDALHRQGIKSFGFSEYNPLQYNRSEAENVPAPMLAQPSPSSTDVESWRGKSSGGTAQHDELQAVHASSKHDLLDAQHPTGDEPNSLPGPPAEAASQPAAAPQKAAGSSHGTGSALSQMHQSMRKTKCESCCPALPLPYFMLLCQVMWNAMS